MFKKIISITISVAFLVNTTVYGLSPITTSPAEEYGGKPKTLEQIYEVAQRRLTANRGPGKLDLEIGPTSFPQGEEEKLPYIGDIKFMSKGDGLWDDGMTSEIFEQENLVDALNLFMRGYARIPEALLQIRKGNFKVERGALPIEALVKTNSPENGVSYTALIHQDIMGYWRYLKRNDVRARITLDGEERTVSLAWGVFFRLARHIMSDLEYASDQDSSIGYTKGGGHLNFSTGELKFQNEEVANMIDGKYAVVNDAIWLFLAAGYFFRNSTRYNTETFLARARWIFPKELEPSVKDMDSEERAEYELWKEFTYLLPLDYLDSDEGKTQRRASGRSDEKINKDREFAIRLAAHFNFHFHSNPDVYEDVLPKLHDRTDPYNQLEDEILETRAENNRKVVAFSGGIDDIKKPESELEKPVQAPFSKSLSRRTFLQAMPAAFASIVLFFSGFFAGRLTVEEPAQEGAVDTSKFITTEGIHFIKDERPFYMMGMNFWSILTLAQTGNWNVVKRELDNLQELGVNVLRIMASGEGPDTEPWRYVPTLFTRPGVINPEGLAALKKVMKELERRGMYAIMTLNNFWPWSGGMAQYIKWATGEDIPYPPPAEGGDWTKYQDFTARFYEIDKAKEIFNDFLRILIPIFSSSPAIMAWELANEPRGRGKVHAYRQWIHETAQFIKELDPNHLVTAGSEGETSHPFPHPDGNGMDPEADHASPYIDFMTFHIWVQNWGWINIDTGGDTTKSHDGLETLHEGDITNLEEAKQKVKEYIARHVEYARRLNKPTLLEEFGFPRDMGSLRPQMPTTGRDAYFEKVFGWVYEEMESGSSPLAGVFPWAWSGEILPSRPGETWKPGDPYTGDPPHEFQGWYSIYKEDTGTLKAIKEYSDKINAIDGVNHPFRFGKYIWKEFKAMLLALEKSEKIPAGTYALVKTHGLAWTDNDGRRHLIDEKVSEETASEIWETSKRALNEANKKISPDKWREDSGKWIKDSRTLKNTAIFHEDIHKKFRQEKFRKLIADIRLSLTRTFNNDLNEAHPFIKAFKLAYGSPQESEITAGELAIDWYIEEFLVLSIQERELFDNPYGTVEIISRELKKSNEPAEIIPEEHLYENLKEVLDLFFGEYDSLPIEAVSVIEEIDKYAISLGFDIGPGKEEPLEVQEKSLVDQTITNYLRKRSIGLLLPDEIDPKAGDPVKRALKDINGNMEDGSIVTNGYRSADTLERHIKSLKSDTGREIIIVVTDDTIDIINTLKRKDPFLFRNIRLLNLSLPDWNHLTVNGQNTYQAWIIFTAALARLMDAETGGAAEIVLRLMLKEHIREERDVNEIISLLKESDTDPEDDGSEAARDKILERLNLSLGIVVSLVTLVEIELRLSRHFWTSA